jgi:hypothetical protein
MMKSFLGRGAARSCAGSCAAAALALLLAACHPGQVENLEETDVVLTRLAPTARFDTMTTYAMPDTVYEILEDEDDDPEWNHALDDDVLAAIRSHMADRGFSPVDFEGADDRDVVLLVFGITAQNWVYSAWYPWYPGWGGWYPWYPPYVTAYEFTSGTLTVQMIEPAAAAEDTVDVWWLGGANGAASSTAAVNRERLVRGVDQMFAQSPYLRAATGKEAHHD